MNFKPDLLGLLAKVAGLALLAIFFGCKAESPSSIEDTRFKFGMSPAEVETGLGSRLELEPTLLDYPPDGPTPSQAYEDVAYYAVVKGSGNRDATTEISVATSLGFNAKKELVEIVNSTIRRSLYMELTSE